MKEGESAVKGAGDGAVATTDGAKKEIIDVNEN